MNSQRTLRVVSLVPHLEVWILGVWIACLAGTSPAQGRHAAPPAVLRLEPAHGSVEVDAARTKTLTITFAQDMRQTGHSICGGGPQFPKILQRPRWQGKRTMVLAVALEPDHTYRMSLNCPAAKNFRSAKGVSLTPTPWSFSTLPAKLLTKVEQVKRNTESLTTLRATLASKYLYYEHKKIDWDALFAQHEAAILAARTDRGWATRVGAMLKVANDLHLYLRVGGHTIGTGSRRIDPLFRPQLLDKYFQSIAHPDRGVTTAKTKDGIAYLMISGWTRNIDFAAVEAVIQGMRDAKALVIDVRPNSGGGENLARQVAQWFVPGTKVYAKHATRKGKGPNNFYRISQRRIQGKAKDARFGRPVAVLMSRYCMSSCEAFLLMMRQAENCELIGQRSYGSSGNPKGHRLPNGVEIFLPSWKVMRLDGSCFEGEGLKPDIEVAATSADFETQDKILEVALARLRQR